MIDARRYVVVKGSAGLGNRLLFLLSSIIFAKAGGRRLVVDWRDGVYSRRGEDAFALLFECPLADPPGTLEGLAAETSVHPGVWRGRLERSWAEMLADGSVPESELSADLSCVDLPRRIVVIGGYGPRSQKVRSHVERAFPGLGSAPNDRVLGEIASQHLRPAAAVEKRADAFATEHLRGCTLGVHVRSSDLETPLAALLGQTRSLRRWLPGVGVFLATDNASVATCFAERFRGVMTSDKWYPAAGQRMHQNRGCPDLAQNALEAAVDLQLLGDCDVLVYSARSTFGRAAAVLSGLSPLRRLNVDVAEGPAKRAVRSMLAALMARWSHRRGRRRSMKGQPTGSAGALSQGRRTSLGT